MKSLWIVAIVVMFVNSFPIDNWEEDPEFKGNFCEGDMDLTEEEERELFAEAESRNAVMGKSRRWPNKTLQYRISRSIGKLFDSSCGDSCSIIDSQQTKIRNTRTTLCMQWM